MDAPAPEPLNYAPVPPVPAVRLGWLAAGALALAAVFAVWTGFGWLMVSEWSSWAEPLVYVADGGALLAGICFLLSLPPGSRGWRRGLRLGLWALLVIHVACLLAIDILQFPGDAGMLRQRLFSFEAVFNAYFMEILLLAFLWVYVHRVSRDFGWRAMNVLTHITLAFFFASDFLQMVRGTLTNEWLNPWSERFEFLAPLGPVMEWINLVAASLALLYWMLLFFCTLVRALRTRRPAGAGL